MHVYIISHMINMWGCVRVWKCVLVCVGGGWVGVCVCVCECVEVCVYVPVYMSITSLHSTKET